MNSIESSSCSYWVRPERGKDRADTVYSVLPFLLLVSPFLDDFEKLRPNGREYGQCSEVGNGKKWRGGIDEEGKK